MIARIWSGRVPAEKAAAYLDLMRTVALPDYRAVPGNRGAWCLHRIEGAVGYFEMLTFWEDTDSVRAFAGEPVDKAKYYDFDEDFLLEMEPTVIQFEVHDG